MRSWIVEIFHPCGVGSLKERVKAFSLYYISVRLDGWCSDVTGEAIDPYKGEKFKSPLLQTRLFNKLLPKKKKKKYLHVLFQCSSYFEMTVYGYQIKINFEYSANLTAFEF